MKQLRYQVIFVVCVAMLVLGGGVYAQGGLLDSIVLPEGFEIAYFAQNVPAARSMTLGENGTLFIGSRGSDRVLAIPNATTTTEAERVITVASGLTSPNGVAVVDSDLYVAEISRILRFDDIEANLDNPPAPVVVTADLPREGHHGWKFMAEGPDGKLYFNVGAPCNVCELNGLFGSISRMNTDGTEIEVYATGVRNSVGFDWHPETGELWFTNNGRDGMGDDVPFDTLHHAPEQGLHFGFPYCHAGNVNEPQFPARNCDDPEFVAPAATLGPHVASLGMRFYTGDMFPEEYHNQIFIAEHCSWNRSVRIGYRVKVAFLNEDGNVVGYRPFAEGWLNESTGQFWGRPVDVQVMPDGALLVSDDAANAIYRITYTG